MRKLLIGMLLALLTGCATVDVNIGGNNGDDSDDDNQPKKNKVFSY